MPEEQHTSYETPTLHRETVTAMLKWSAAIKGAGDVSIVSRCSGTLDEIKVKNGQHVKAGDVLFLIDSRTALNSLEHAKADAEHDQRRHDHKQPKPRRRPGPHLEPLLNPIIQSFVKQVFYPH